MAAMGMVEELETLYQKDPSLVSFKDPKEWTPLHHAAAYGQQEAIAFLCNRGAADAAADRPDKVSGADVNAADGSSRTPLHLSVIHDKVNVLRALVKHRDKIDLTKGDENGLTALHHTALRDHDEAALILIESYTVCPNQPCNNGFYPIHLAAKNASVKVLEVLLSWAEKRGCERANMIILPDLEGNVPLHLAVHGGEIKAVEICLKNGANISMQQHDRNTPVHLACAQGALDIVKLMFTMQPQQKLEVLNTKDARGMTPLHCSAMFDHPDLVRYLVMEGASLNTGDCESRTPLLLAAGQRCWRSVEALLQLGADPGIRDNSCKNILHIIVMNGGSINDISPMKLAQLLNDQDISGCSPLHYASKSGQIKSLESLIQLGASVRTKNHRNESPLHFAAKYGRYNTVRQLLESTKGFLILNESNGDGKTALHIASEEGHSRLVQLLISKGALLHRDHQGRTPLHLSASRGHIETINILLAVHGHMLDQTDREGNSALHMAVREGRAETVSMLMSLGCLLNENKKGATAIDVAITYKLEEVAIAMVTHERGPTEVLPMGSKIHGCVSMELIRSLPKVFEAALNQAITKSNFKEDSKRYYITYNFSPLQLNCGQIDQMRSVKKDTDWRPPPLFACNAMVNSRRVELLMHPLTQKFLQMKWQAYGMYVNMIYLLIYITFLTSVTIFASGILGGKCQEQLLEALNPTSTSTRYLNHTDGPAEAIATGLQIKHQFGTFGYLLAILIAFFSGCGLIKEIFHAHYQKMEYLADGMNLIEWILYLSAICMVLPVFVGTEWRAHQYNSAAMAVFTAWFTLLLYFQRFDRIGIYIVMFLEILRTLLKVLAVFSVLIIAFGLNFFSIHFAELQGNHMAYSSVPMSMLRTFSMMLGEIDFLNTFVYPYFEASAQPNIERSLPFPNTTFTILVVFMILMPILLMNLLIGLAVGDIESVKKNAQLKRVAMQVHLHTGLENKLPSLLISRVNKQEIVVYPNDDSVKTSFLQGLVQALNFCMPYKDTSAELDVLEPSCSEEYIWEELESHQLRFRSIAAQLDQQTKLLKLIMQKMEINSEAIETDDNCSASRRRDFFVQY
ncbi:transient receptor potential cation channel subfamily A member 1 [Hyalella azteca]|uniref:Transient receptor potential cation channel subfamily A member 1 n=1 Tax=Hyalella azteca TaxID=294128 RepID=A0A979FLC6_HYAAZ|nr:transient receptor potential cation channel subfamily A member 1 [Hyalella azteca]